MQGYDFFGLSPEYKKTLHDSIFNMTYYDSKFTFTELYNMPVYLRRYYENKLIQIRKEENDEMKKAQSKRK